jgi:Flp pilus assembly protein TadG
VKSGLARLRRSPNRESGAAAVEFALLVPIFVILAVGSMSVGLALWHNIALTQAARDAARYGSTLQLTKTVGTCPSTTSDVDVACLVSQVRDQAIREAGWAWDPAAPTTTLPDRGYVCVAFVQGTASLGSVATTRITVGNPQVGEPTTGACVSEPTSEVTRMDRIQVVVSRDAAFNAVLFTKTWLLTSRAIVPYERANPK